MAACSVTSYGLKGTCIKIDGLVGRDDFNGAYNIEGWPEGADERDREKLQIRYSSGWPWWCFWCWLYWKLRWLGRYMWDRRLVLSFSPNRRSRRGKRRLLRWWMIWWLYWWSDRCLWWYGCIDGIIDCCNDGWSDGWSDRLIDGSDDGSSDGYMNIDGLIDDGFTGLKGRCSRSKIFTLGVSNLCVTRKIDYLLLEAEVSNEWIDLWNLQDNENDIQRYL